MTSNGAAVLTLILLTTMAMPVYGEPIRPFTVAEEIGLAHFDNTYSFTAPPELSPDGRLIMIPTVERGVLARNLVEDELRVYSVAALRHFLGGSQEGKQPAPLLDLREATYKEGPVISAVRWLPDSSGLAFLLRSTDGSNQLALIGIRETQPSILSMKGQYVTAFGVRDAEHYAYAVLTPGREFEASKGSGWTILDGTGIPIQYMLLPGGEVMAHDEFAVAGGKRLRSVIWAATGSTPHRVASREKNEAIVIYPESVSLALSPDAHTLCVSLPVPRVPQNWLEKFPPPDPHYPYRMRAGEQNLQATVGLAGTVTTGFALVDLLTGIVTPVNGTPTGSSNGWAAVVEPAWSDDGKAVLLPDAYQQPEASGKSAERPCVAVFYKALATMQCLEYLQPLLTKKGVIERKAYYPFSLRFVPHNDSMAVVGLKLFGSDTHIEKVFARGSTGYWRVKAKAPPVGSPANRLKVYIKEGLNQPPVVVARETGTAVSRVIWDPNPQLKYTALGTATVYHWKDASGRIWTGGLYLPANYVVGERYPLVIQTHGFSKEKFRPSGLYSTAFAARALAAAGIAVLQVDFCHVLVSPDEGPCQIRGFRSAVRQLAVQGLIDPNRVGIIGFSRSVYWVLEAMTSGSLRLAAASVTDGIGFGYWQYLVWVDNNGNSFAHEARNVIGASPFARGLRLWVTRSPEFKMEKVNAPLLVSALGRYSLLYMWEPYALLRYLGKPVDLVMLNADEHVLTEPALRLVSQGGTVDWFRFWLQGYESTDPAMAGEYRNWEKLCDLQRAENYGKQVFCVPTDR